MWWFHSGYDIEYQCAMFNIMVIKNNVNAWIQNNHSNIELDNDT